MSQFRRTPIKLEQDNWERFSLTTSSIFFKKAFYPCFLNMFFFQVVVLCSMLWALPPIWPFYKKFYYPFWSRYLYPTVQIALMSSVYCTIVMSWERYVRICLVTRLINSYSLYFGDRKFCLYIVFIVMFPIIFYIPKFFEVRI